jgi:hypothetical protein
MLKILGNSSGKNNKSCRIFYNEYSKIGFAFFLFFYDCLRILQDSTKAIYYLRLGFTGRPLELLFLLQIGPWFTKNTLEITKEKQCSPLAIEAAVPAEIGRLRWRVWPGKEWGRKRGSPGLDLWPETGRKSSRRRPAAVAGGTRRWSFCSCTVDRMVGTPTARAGSGDRRVGAWAVPWRRNHARLALVVGAALAGPAARSLREDSRCAAFIAKTPRRNTGFNAAVRRPASTCVHIA